MSLEGHNLYEGDIGAYLLDALAEAEVRRFERHLRDCPVCRDEVERLRPAADALPRSVVPMTPPASLRTALMKAVEADVREREGQASSGRSRWRPLAGLRRRAAEATDALGSMRPTVAWVAVSVVLLAGVVSGAAGLYALTQLTGDDAARTLSAQVDRDRLPLASGSLVVHEGGSPGAILRVHGMPTLEPRSVYQLWIRRNDETVSQALFSVGEDGNGAAAVIDDLAGVDAVTVTREPAGGARAPSEKPVLTVPL